MAPESKKWRYYYIPGRLRLTVPELCRNPSAARIIEDHFAVLANVRLVAANPLTGRILIVHEPSDRTLESVIKDLSALRPKLRYKTRPSKRVKQKIIEPEDMDLKWQTINVVGTGGVLGFLALRRSFIGPSRFAASPTLFNLNTAATLVSSYPLLQSGFGYITQKFNISHDLLLGLASFGLLSLRQSLLGLTVLWLTNLSAYLQSLTLKKSRDTLSTIISTAQSVEGKKIEVPDITAGYFAVAQGQWIPKSGEVLSGAAVVDESAVTGSFMPVIKAPGAEALAGSLVKHGEITVVSKPEMESALEKQLGELIQRSSQTTRNRQAIKNYAEKISIIALLTSAGAFLLWRDIGRSLAILLASSPSAASISVSSAYRAGLANAARRGILVKDMQAMELLTECDVVLLDKTGTLTFGQPKVETIISLDDRYTNEEIISLAAACEKKLSHPVARSLAQQARDSDLKKDLKGKQKVALGQGVRGVIDGKLVLVGNRSLLTMEKVDLRKAAFKAKRLLLNGHTVTYVAADNKLIGLIGLKDAVRPNSLKVIEDLRSQGIKQIGILTGDAQEAAENLGCELGISDVWGELLPKDKAEIVERLQSKGKIVSVVGDGINDIPAFRRADLGIAMSDNRQALTLKAAKIVIVGSDLTSFNYAIHIAKISSEVARQNLVISAGANISGLALTLGAYTNPLAATVLGNLSSLAVLVNSARLLKMKGHKGVGYRRKAGCKKRNDRKGCLRAKSQNELKPVLHNMNPIRFAQGAISRMWFEMAQEEVIDVLRTHQDNGLSRDESDQRFKLFGPNRLQEPKKPSTTALFFGQFQNLVTKLLLGAGMVSFILGEFADGTGIFLIVALEVVVGAIQERRAEESLANLKKLAAPEAIVIRDGLKRKIDANLLVPGDVIILEAGSLAPADSRLIETSCFEVEESLLTGESAPVSKQNGICQNGHLGVTEQNNMVFMGSLVTRGRSKAVVVATGRSTEMGKIASLLENVEAEATPLQKQLNKLGRNLSLACIGACGMITLGGIARGRPLYDMLRIGVSLAVGAIPEGLPAIVTIAMAFGVQRMVKRNAIVRRLPAVETLAYATVICSDKTGTLTTNEMTVTSVYTGRSFYKVDGTGFLPHGSFSLEEKKVNPGENEALGRTLVGCVLCNNASLYHNNTAENWEIQGDPTEAALLVAAAKAGIYKNLLHCRRIQEIPFDPLKRLMAVAVEKEDLERLVFVKGAPDEVLLHCVSACSGEAEQFLDLKQRDEIARANEKMTRDALRVMAVAFKYLVEKDMPYDEDDLFQGLTFAGLLGMIDPPRPEVQAAVEKCKQAGIKVNMITGDHRNTAVAIAKKLAILNDGMVISGKEIEEMNDNQLEEQIDRIDVIYRASPLQKLKVVKAFKKKGYVVVMTGDGVNDAPAVKEADIGIAMGKAGTDVTREASCITLTDDSFATIVAAVEEGRTIKSNIRKFIRYVLAGNLGEIAAVSSAALLNLPIPLEPGHILWINLVTEGIPALALGMEPPNSKGMNLPPSQPNESIFGEGLGRKIITRGLGIGTTTMGLFTGTYLLNPGNLPKAKTMAFANLVASQMFHVFDCRSENNTDQDAALGKNRYLPPAVAISSGLLLGAIYLPGLRAVLKTQPLGILDWGAILLSSGIFSRL